MSRSKKTWNHLVDFQGNYIDFSNLIGVPGDKGEPGSKGDVGEKGSIGEKGDTGADGNDAPPFLQWKGEVATEANLPASDPATAGDVYKATDTGFLHIDNGDGTYTTVENFDMLEGPKGDTGEKGTTGEKGQKGETGAEGGKGEVGEKGATGEKGEKGEIGEKGEEGKEGAVGEKGTEGQKGQRGPRGIQGQGGIGIDIIGSIPDSGPPDSALCTQGGDAILDGDGNIWVCDGSGNWTNTGFIQGPEGPQGENGGPGPEGPAGPDGPAGPRGDKGNVGPQGVKGDKGDTGNTGDKGSPAEPITITGVIDYAGAPAADLCTGVGEGIVDTDGKLWVCDGAGNWTEIPWMEGPKGETGGPGVKGDPGDTGPDGQDGEKGDTGSQGVKGEQGIDGIKGDSGTNGEKGVKGAKGEVGQSPFTFQGEKDTSGDLPSDAEKGDIWYVKDEDKYYVSDGTADSWIEIDFDATTIPEPADDSQVYGRQNTSGVGDWQRAVSLDGDTMTGGLVAPSITSGVAGDASLYLDDDGTTYTVKGDADGLYYEDAKLAKHSDVEDLQNATVNLAETQAVIAPMTFGAVYMLRETDDAVETGEFYMNGTDYSDVTQVCINNVTNDNQGNIEDILENVEKLEYLTILSATTPYGVSGRVANIIVYDDKAVVDLDPQTIKAVDDPNGGGFATGVHTIKCQNIIDPKNINEINNLLEGLNGSLNNIADYRSVVMVDGNEFPPDNLPGTGNPIPEGKLYFNTRYLQLYIRIGTSWLGLL